MHACMCVCVCVCTYVCCVCAQAETSADGSDASDEEVMQPALKRARASPKQLCDIDLLLCPEAILLFPG